MLRWLIFLGVRSNLTRQPDLRCLGGKSCRTWLTVASGSGADSGRSQLVVAALRAGQASHRERQRSHAAAHVLRGGVLVRAVADAAAAGDEDHGGGRDAGHEEGVVVGAAHHLGVADAHLLDRGLSRLQDRGAAGSRRVGVEHLQLDGCASAGSNLVGRVLDLLHHAVAARLVNVAHIDLDLRISGNTVHGAREDLHQSSGCDGVDGACAERGFLHSKRQLGGRQARILAERHQQRASMAAVAHEADLEGGGRRDGGDDADVGAVVLQVGSLLDVELHEMGDAALRYAGAGQHGGHVGAAVPGGVGGLQEVGAVDVGDGREHLRCQGARHAAAADAAQPEAGRLL
mmetsp:Transcript_20774/g.52362  ORF Transcript_20774/g.52362 Transcript_20774/m.52362 type:complete len:345 (+) Transcript_20774:211-1245(+)